MAYLHILTDVFIYVAADAVGRRAGWLNVADGLSLSGRNNGTYEYITVQSSHSLEAFIL